MQRVQQLPPHQKKVFWSRDDSDDSDSSLVYVAGLRDAGNRRQPTRKQQSVAGKRTQEVKASIPTEQPPIEDLPLSLQDDKDFIRDGAPRGGDLSRASADVRPRKPVLQSVPYPQLSKKQTKANSQRNKQSMDLQKLNNLQKSLLENRKLAMNVDRSKNHQLDPQKENVGPYPRKASLKDLRAEDKQRVANLVKELARIGDEKESAVETLYTERFGFEKQITELLDQQEKVLQEREVIQRQLYECQKLLSGYQQQLLERDDQSTAPPSKNQNNGRKKSNEMTPTRQEHPGVDPKEFVPSPRQQGNYDISNRPHSQKSGRTPEKNQHRISPRSVPQVPGARLFTHRLDQLLDEEPAGPARDDGQIVRAIPAKAELPRDHLFGIGPLDAPVLSSTGRSDATNKVEEFRPLQPYDSLPSSVDTRPVDMTPKKQVQIDTRRKEVLDSTTDEEGFIAYCRALPAEERRHQLVMQREALLEEQKRLRHILAEQETLLHQKQDQLHRQQQLQTRRLQFFHNTGYFPPASDLPDPSAYIGPTVSLGGAAAESGTLHQTSTAPAFGNVQHDGQMMNHVRGVQPAQTGNNHAQHPPPSTATQQSTSQAKPRPLTLPATRYLSQMDTIPPVDAHRQDTHPMPQMQYPPQGPNTQPAAQCLSEGNTNNNHQIRSSVEPSDDGSSSTLGREHSIIEDTTWPAARYLPQEDNLHQQHRYDDDLSESITESLKNLHFLENHGVRVSAPHKTYHRSSRKQSGGTSPRRPVTKKRSPATNPHHSVRPARDFGSNSELDKVVKHLNNVDINRPSNVPLGSNHSGKQYNHLLDVVEPDEPLVNYELSDTSSCLLDIVDEIESRRSAKRDSYQRSPVTPSQNGYHDYHDEQEDEDVAEELEESQVLSEVFFVN